MPSVIAIISKAVFEKEQGRHVAPGSVLAVHTYRSQHAALSPLKQGGSLYLVTVREGALWLVAVLRAPRFRGGVWSAAPNREPFANINTVLPLLRFGNGKGIDVAPEKLGMALQTPRVLVSEDERAIDTVLRGKPRSAPPRSAPPKAPPTKAVKPSSAKKATTSRGLGTLSVEELQRFVTRSSGRSDLEPLFVHPPTNTILAIDDRLFSDDDAELSYFDGRSWKHPPLTATQLLREEPIDERAFVAGAKPSEESVVRWSGRAWRCAQRFGRRIRWHEVRFNASRGETQPTTQLWLEASDDTWASRLMAMCAVPIEAKERLSGPYFDEQTGSVLFRSYYSLRRDKFIGLGVAQELSFAHAPATFSPLDRLKDYLLEQMKAKRAVSIVEHARRTTKTLLAKEGHFEVGRPAAKRHASHAAAVAAFLEAERDALQQGYVLADIVPIPS